MKSVLCFLVAVVLQLHTSQLSAQESTQACKIALTSLIGTYSGECKNGYANGKGEANGIHRYSGNFKNGLPNGEGKYYENDSVFYVGNFLDGIKEGKGEMHYVNAQKGDSIVKGYWSGDEYRGKKYITYKASGLSTFDQVDFSYSDKPSNSITFEISTTSGSPAGALTGMPSGVVVSLRDIVAYDGIQVRRVSDYVTGNKWSATFEVSKLPIKLACSFSNGQRAEIELYRAADWKIRLFSNR